MKEYIFSVIGAALVAGVVSLLLPEGSGNSRVVRMLAALCVLCALAAPLSGKACDGDLTGIFEDILNTVPEDGAEDKYYEILTGIGRAELEKKLSELICREFSANESDITVTVEAVEADGVFAVRRVRVGLRAAAIFLDPYELEDFVEGLVGADCDTYY